MTGTNATTYQPTTIEDRVRAARKLLADNPAVRDALKTVGISEDEYVFRYLKEHYEPSRLSVSTDTTKTSFPWSVQGGTTVHPVVGSGYVWINPNTAVTAPAPPSTTIRTGGVQ